MRKLGVVLLRVVLGELVCPEPTAASTAVPWVLLALRNGDAVLELVERQGAVIRRPIEGRRGAQSLEVHRDGDWVAEEKREESPPAQEQCPQLIAPEQAASTVGTEVAAEVMDAIEEEKPHHPAEVSEGQIVSEFRALRARSAR